MVSVVECYIKYSLISDDGQMHWYGTDKDACRAAQADEEEKRLSSKGLRSLNIKNTGICGS